VSEPLPELDEQREMLLSMLRGTLGTQRFVYLSGPITTGLKFVAWQRSEGRAIADEAEWKAARGLKVIKPNCATLLRSAEGLRADGLHVIEPGSFETGARIWPQPDYYELWKLVIDRHGCAVRFLDGWQFSGGCANEFLCALQCDRPTFTVDGKGLSKDAALALIDRALPEMQDDDPQIRSRRDDLIGRRAQIEAA
jgi:hypothetical protein